MDWRTSFRFPEILVRAVNPCGALPRRLSDALNPLTGQGRPIDAARFLHTVGTDRLMVIDQRLRGYLSLAYCTWPSDTLRCIVTCPMSEEARQSLLFVACSHRDGREREKAVGHLGEFPGSLTLAAALIRSVDWVPQVRSAARDAVVRMLRTCAIDDVVAVWPIVLQLQHRERSTDGWLAEKVEGWAFASASDGFLCRARQAGGPDVRVWAYRKSLERGETSLLPQALMQPDPRIGLHALRHAQATLDARSMGALAASGLRAPHPVVRREGLRALAAVDVVAARAALPAALLDRSAGVRRLAAYLARQGGADARATWRAALDRPAAQAHAGALASLAEDPQEEDAARFRRCLPETRSVVRQHALKGLLRIGQPIPPEVVGQQLQLGGGRVLATLAAAVRDSAIVIDPSLVRGILADPEVEDDGRVRLIGLLGFAGLWAGLKLLLAARTGDVDRQWWLAAIDDWIGRSETYAPLSDMRKRALLDATTERAAELGPTRVSQIQAALLRH
ncbi:hypothetical protein FKV24_016410 [Lysobacter maris]|uniref:HEAT repeat domain-containing protein n=1 Tax=Marilutibacter maris TaxID=1605891 RepID=A0A508A5Y3_9GAMM|nr:hypothetical protein [Lysobacter maris]KAB8168045.1 hypothetical protein FKV24_016410 [Lysobacter maris]